MERISIGGHFYVGTDDEGRAILADESNERHAVAADAVAQEYHEGTYRGWLLSLADGGVTPINLDGALFLRQLGFNVRIVTRQGRSI